MTILVLGHKGMLGNMVCKYYSTINIKIETTNFRWNNNKFKHFIKNNKSDFLINCIGINHQEHPSWMDLESLNINLPIWLSKHFKGYILHPTSDAEFDGNLKMGELYQKNDYKTTNDEYGISKSISSLLLFHKNNIKQIRTSIIGPETNGSKYLLEWFLNNKENIINGYKNHYWNGITTLEWSKQSWNIIKNWNNMNKIIQLGTDTISKYNLLIIINKIFNCKKNVRPIKLKNTINRCIKSDYKIDNITTQLEELKKFSFSYGK